MSEWDENRRFANLANHGVDVRELDALAWSNALEFEDLRRDYGERS
jgi:uncharacterized DUF497 family protein